MTVLVGFVPNSLGAATLSAGVEESRRRREPVLVVNLTRDDVLVDARRAAADELDRVRHELDAADLPEVEVRQVEAGSDPAQSLLDLAAAEQVSVIVVGLRRRTPVGKLILGSTVQQVLLGATCPVLSVHGD